MYLRACRRTTTSVRAVRQRPTSSASTSSNKSPAIAWVQRVLMSGDLNKERSDRTGPMAAVNLDRFWEVGIVSSPDTLRSAYEGHRPVLTRLPTPRAHFGPRPPTDFIHKHSHEPSFSA